MSQNAPAKTLVATYVIRGTQLVKAHEYNDGVFRREDTGDELTQLDPTKAVFVTPGSVTDAIRRIPANHPDRALIAEAVKDGLLTVLPVEVIERHAGWRFQPRTAIAHIAQMVGVAQNGITADEKAAREDVAKALSLKVVLQYADEFAAAEGVARRAKAA